MATALQTVSNNIQALMANTVPRVSQKRIGEVIKLRQPQVSLRLNGYHPWGLDELDAIAQLFRVPLTLLVDPDPGAVYRWLAENGRIDIGDVPNPHSLCNPWNGSQDPLPFDDVVIDLRDKDHPIVKFSTPERAYALTG